VSPYTRGRISLLTPPICLTSHCLRPCSGPCTGQRILPPVDVPAEAAAATPAPAALAANSAGPAARSDSAGGGGGGSASEMHRGVHASSKALQAGLGQADSTRHVIDTHFDHSVVEFWHRVDGHHVTWRAVSEIGPRAGDHSATAARLEGTRAGGSMRTSSRPTLNPLLLLRAGMGCMSIDPEGKPWIHF
jgi:hypothetical protein